MEAVRGRNDYYGDLCIDLRPLKIEGRSGYSGDVLCLEEEKKD